MNLRCSDEMMHWAAFEADRRLVYWYRVGEACFVV